MTKFKAGLEPLRAAALSTVILVSFTAHVSVRAGTPMPFTEEAALNTPGDCLLNPIRPPTRETQSDCLITGDLPRFII